MQLEIIAVAVELGLRAGVQPDIERFRSDFSYLGNELTETFTETIEQFVSQHCPIGSAVGSLPKQVDGYLVEEEIGRGGMGVVYKARQLSLDRTVALKVLFFSREEILQEARSLAGLVHPNICGVYDIGMIAGLPFMAMQYLRGQRLTDFIKSSNPVEIASCVEIVCKLCKAIHEAHETGVVHLDVKPSNILLKEKLEPVLTDFGLAQKTNQLRRSSHGSPSFLAPEQLESAPISNRKLCDIYSLGTVLYEMLTGRRAFHGTVENVIDQVLNDPPRRPSDYRQDITPSLEQACLRAMNKTPDNRFHSMIEFHNCLQDSISPTTNH